MTTRMESPDDGALLARIAARGTAVFALLYDWHERLAFGYAVGLRAGCVGAPALMQAYSARTRRRCACSGQ